MNTGNRKGLVLLAGGLLILTGIVGLSLHSPLSAAGREGRRGVLASGGEFGIERWKKELGLSEKQIERLREMRLELRKERVEKALAHAQIDLDLSAEQTAALKALRGKHLEQREAMRVKHRGEFEAMQNKTGLTDEQVAGLGMMRGEGRRPGDGMNLMRRGREYARFAGEAGEVRERIEKILTEEQMQKLDEMRESRRDELRSGRPGEGRRGQQHRRPHCDHDD